MKKICIRPSYGYARRGKLIGSNMPVSMGLVGASSAVRQDLEFDSDSLEDPGGARYEQNVYKHFSGKPSQEVIENMIMLKEGVPKYIPCTREGAFNAQLRSIILDLDKEKYNRVMQVMNNKFLSAETKQQYIRELTGLKSTVAEEWRGFELKSSILFTNGRNEYPLAKQAQLYMSADSLAGMANTGDGTGRLIWGVRDNGEVLGLERELSENFMGLSRDKILSTVILNALKKHINYLPFLSSLHFSWYTLEGKLILMASVSYKSDKVVIVDGRLPVRIEGTLHYCEGEGIIDYAIDRYNLFHNNK